MEKQIDDFVTMGYKIENQGQHSTKVKEKDWGSPPVHGFVFFFTLIGSALAADAIGLPAGGIWGLAIIASVTYAAYSRYTAEEVVIKVEEDADA